MTTPATSSQTWAFVFARGGSKGVPRKNIAPLGGRPLIAHSIEVALASPSIHAVAVSTDDEEIADAARQAGAHHVLMRPPELAADTAAEIDAWRHAVRTLQGDGHRFDIMVSLPATSPLRTVADVEGALELFRAKNADFGITVHPAAAHPAFNMVTLDEDARPVFSFRQGGRLIRRQDAPPAYQIAAVAFIARTDVVLSGVDLYSTRVCAYEVPHERAVDIDAPLDLEFIRFLYARQADQ